MTDDDLRHLVAEAYRYAGVPDPERMAAGFLLVRHEFVPPGQVSPDRPAPDRCMQCGKPAGVHLAVFGEAYDPKEVSR